MLVWTQVRIVLFFIINSIKQMNGRFNKTLVLAVILLISLTSSKICKIGEVLFNQKCVSCKDLPNTQVLSADQAPPNNQCLCQTTFLWSNLLKKCIEITPVKENRQHIEMNDQIASTKKIFENSRLLATLTCNQTTGFILYSTTINSKAAQLCVNCRVLPYGLAALNTTVCNCDQSFTYNSSLVQCYCNTNFYIDPYSNTCVSCPTSGPLASNCTKCQSPYTMSILGCVYTLSLVNGANSTSGCVTGYTFSSKLAACICDFSSGYVLNANGVCVQCSTADTNCITCKSNYYFDGYICKDGSLIPNFSTTLLACKAGTTFKSNVFTNQVFTCACSAAAGNYQNGASCNPCTTPPTGVTTANCQLCASTSKFYLGSVECIYCPGVSNAVGTATSNGCDCKTNYYWNMTSDQCECDFAKGYIAGLAGSCVLCSSISNTGTIMFPTSCSCLQSYKWNQATQTCNCDTSLPNIFLQGGVCYNCLSFANAFGMVGTDGASCLCYVGYQWNSLLRKCLCDVNNNFVTISNGSCIACWVMPFTGGLANDFGCTCVNGLSWSTNSSQCLCPSGSVMIGMTCTSCSKASLPNGVTVTNCNTCKNTQGFVSQSLGCYYCPSQTGANPAVTNGNCTCSQAEQAWKPLLGSCVCDWTANYVTNVGSTALTCIKCPYYFSGTSTCACNYGFLRLDNNNQVCTDTSYDPNAALSNGVFSCNTGYMWSTSSPYQCILGYSVGAGYYSSSSNTYTDCSSAVDSSGCQLCSLDSGYLYIPGTNICLLCSTVTNSTRTATSNGCGCSTGTSWNSLTLTCDNVICSGGTTYNPATSTCACDPIKSINVGGVCILCSSIAQSAGITSSSTTCSCVSPYVWVSSVAGGNCTSVSCTSKQIVLSNGSCFTCPAANGTGTVVGSVCGCNANYAWNSTATGGSCICDFTKAYSIGTTCNTCPTVTQDANSAIKGDGKGGCVCTGSSVWTVNGTSGKCSTCNAAAGVVILANGSCFTCGTTGTYTTTKIVSAQNNSCNCSITNFTWNTAGYCDCGSNSVIVPLGTTFTCFSCINSTALTSAKVDSLTCSCISASLTWNATRKSCGCNSNSIIIGTGASATCFTCPTLNGNGLSNGTVCICNSIYLWAPTTTGGSCTCNFTKTYTTTGSDCIACPTAALDPNSAARGDGTGGCVCNGNYKWTVVGSTGACAACSTVSGVILLANNNCFTCGATGTFTLSKVQDASNNTCTCSLGVLTWNSAGYCDCGTGSVVIPFGTSYTCFVCSNASAYTIAKVSSFNCSCVSANLKWNATISACGCNSSSIIIGSGSTTSCFVCSTTNGNGLANGNACVCKPNYVWQPSATGGSCVCDYKITYLAGASCLLCPTSAQDINSAAKGDGNGGCVCTSTYLWTSNSTSGKCSTCNIANGVILLASGSCFTCGTTGTFTSTKLVDSKNNSCNCNITTLKWNNAGYCDCGASSIIVVNGTSYSCFVCSNNSAYTSTKADVYNCNCVSSALIWNLATKSCGCASANSIVVGTGSAATCFDCSPTGNVLGITADRTACLCVGKLVWLNASSTCGCSNNSQIIIGSGYMTQCVSCSSIQYGATTAASPTACKCLGIGLVYNSSCGGSCACPVNNIILPSFTCLACPAGTTPLTPYQCLCAAGSIWSYVSQTCLQCGGTSIPNSLSTGSTNFACYCGTGYVWDVMTQSCILSTTCVTVAASCMKCPTGTASTLNSTAARNLFEGATVQASLNGTFTNYNQIKGYQCTCASGISWDSLRLRCYTSGLQ